MSKPNYIYEDTLFFQGGLEISPEDASEFIKNNSDVYYRLEYLDGKVRAQASPSRNHAVIVSNVISKIHPSLEGGCITVSGFAVKIYNEKTQTQETFEPDISVICDYEDYEKPLILVEVLSPSTAKYDITQKLAKYMSIPELCIYYIIDQKSMTVYEYDKQGVIIAMTIHSDKNSTLNFLNAEITLEDVYRNVHF